MIPERFTKKLTFLIIPEANRNVRRYRLPVALLYAVPCVVAALAAVTATLAATHTAVLQSNSALKEERMSYAASQERTVAAKDAEIARLQDEVLRLSQEAETFAAKMSELQSLEREILSLTEADGQSASPSAERAATTASAASADSGFAGDGIAVLSAGASLGYAGTGPASANVGSSFPSAAALSWSPGGESLGSDAGRSEGIGGLFVPVDTEDALRLSETTLDSFEKMAAEAAQLEGSLQQALQQAEKLAHLRRITPSINPTISTRVTSTFGYRRDPFTRSSAYHKGIDFGGDVGDSVFSTADGKVSETGYDKGMGNFVKVKHGNGIETVYMHLSKSTVKEGQNVTKGEKIGELGSTGRSTGPHLHYEVHKNGEAVNPKPYIQNQKG